jgi:hypothetical protein
VNRYPCSWSEVLLQEKFEEKQSLKKGNPNSKLDKVTSNKKAHFFFPLGMGVEEPQFLFIYLFRGKELMIVHRGWN